MKRIIPCLLVALPLLAACEEGPTTTESWKEYGIESTFVDVTKDGPMPVVVFGDPFGDGTAGERAVAAMQTVEIGREAGFRLTPPGAAEEGARTYVILNGSGANDRSICRGKRPETRPVGEGELTLRMAFCGGERLLSDVNGRSPNIRESTHEFFAALIRSATRSIYRDKE
jgi:hypothetical protein